MASSTCKGSDEVPCQECDVCKNLGTTTVAISYCPLCPEFLCKACEKVHRGSKHTMHHKLLTGSAFHSGTTPIPNVMCCGDHTSIVIDLYCKSHDEVICSACQIASHRTCEIAKVSQITQRLMKGGDFEKCKNRLENLKSAYENLKTKRKKDKQTLTSQLDACVEEMRQIRDQINEALDEIENALMNEIHRVNASITQDEESHIAILEDALSRITEHLKTLTENNNMQNEVKFVAMKRSYSAQMTFGETLANIKKVNNRNEIAFKLNEGLRDAVQRLQSIETVLMTDETTSRTLRERGGAGGVGITRDQTSRKSPLDMSLFDGRPVHTGADSVLDCTFMGDSHLVLCTGDGLILLDKAFNIKSELDIRAERVAAVGDNEVLVTQGVKKQIQKVELFPGMRVNKTLKMDKLCCGITVNGGEMYVGCTDGHGNGELQVRTMDGKLQRILGVTGGKLQRRLGVTGGKLQRTLGVTGGEYVFVWPHYVTVSDDGSKIFVSDIGTYIVTCLDRQGHVMYQYSEKELRDPNGMYLDCSDNLLVCDGTIDNVYVIGPDGRGRTILLSQTNGLSGPRCIAFRERDACLVVGNDDLNHQKSLLCFTTK